MTQHKTRCTAWTFRKSSKQSHGTREGHQEGNTPSPWPKQCQEQAPRDGFMCLYVCQEIHTKLWLSNVQHSLDLWVEEWGINVPCLQVSAGIIPHPTSYCTPEKSRKVKQGYQDSSLLPSYRRKCSCGEDFSSDCRGDSHSSALDLVPAIGGGMEILPCPLSGQKSWMTNKRFYLAAGCWPYRRMLP